jgi:hypothetical protein
MGRGQHPARICIQPYSAMYEDAEAKKIKIEAQNV